MRIVLPSLGHYGTKIVEMRQPMLDDLRAVHSMNQEDDLLKVQFVQRLVNVDLRTITKYDLDYLYTVAAFSTALDSVTYTVECPKCHKEHSFEYHFGGQEIKTLEKLPKVVTRKIYGEDYTFRVLSAQMHLDAIEYAMSYEGDDQSFEDSYNDAVAAAILGKTVEETRQLDMGIYVAAHIFHKVTFHGVNLEDVQQCDACNAVIDTHLNTPTSLIKVSLTDLMDKYSSISEFISFEAFIKFTLPEYNSFIKTLNDGEK